MGKYFFEQNRSGKCLYYQPSDGEQLRKDKIERWNQQGIDGLASMEIVLRDSVEVVQYMLRREETLYSFLSAGVSEERLLDLIEKELEIIASAEEAGIDPKYIIYNENCIFVGEEPDEIEFVLYPASFKTNGMGICSLILESLQTAQINSNQYNIKQYLEEYLLENATTKISDIKEYIGNIKKQLFGQKQYSGQQSLSCRLGEQNIQIEELLEIASPKFVTTRMMEEQPMEQKAFLVRCSTKERIPITKAEFLLGTEEEKVDYVIRDNRAVSRVHAEVLYRDGKYYLRDLDSTNHTFVNRVLLRGATEMELLSGVSVIFANEAFQFEQLRENGTDYLFF